MDPPVGDCICGIADRYWDWNDHERVLSDNPDQDQEGLNPEQDHERLTSPNPDQDQDNLMRPWVVLIEIPKENMDTDFCSGSILNA